MKTISAKATESALRRYLKEEGYSLSARRRPGQNGVDVVASRSGERIDLEVVGYSSHAPKRARDFDEVFFRAVSRLAGGATRLVICLPVEFKHLLKKRVEHCGEAWERLGKAFPELEVWLVETRRCSCQKFKFIDWLDLPRAAARTILHILKAEVTGPSSLRVEFNDGVVKEVDLRPLLTGPVFEPLHDPALFRQVRVDPECQTVVWPNGADLAPEALHELEAIGQERERTKVA